MKNTLIALLIICAGVPEGVAREHEYEVPIRVLRYGQPGLIPVKNIEVSAKQSALQFIFEVEPGRADANGLSQIRFKSQKRVEEVHYFVTEGPDGNLWFVTPHGCLSNGACDPSKDKSEARPADKGLVTLFAFPATEAAAVASQELEAGNSMLVGIAVAAAVTVPPLGNPLNTHHTVAEILHTSPDNAKEIVSHWQLFVEKELEDSRLDEKVLSALLNGDLEEAADLVVMADSLNAEEKNDLIVVPDTKRLVETIYQFIRAAQDDKSGFPDADTKLKEIEAEIQPLRPAPDGRFPGNAIERSNIEDFTNMTRENITR